MKTCYRAFIVRDDIGEVYGFFELNGSKLTLTHWFDANDASYRSEYMDPLLEYFGIEMMNLPEKYLAKAEKLITKSMGV